VAIGGNKDLVAKNPFQVDPKGLNSIAKGVSCRYSRDVLKHVMNEALVSWLVTLIFVGALVMELLLVVLGRELVPSKGSLGGGNLGLSTKLLTLVALVLDWIRYFHLFFQIIVVLPSSLR
jgi:hypothetical protein